MKKVKSADTDDLRPEHRRDDFGPMARGKYSARLKAASNIVLLAPEVAKVVSNADAVNDALTGLIKLAQSAARPARRTPRTRA